MWWRHACQKPLMKSAIIANNYILVNRDIDVAVAQVKAILQAERLRRDRQVGLTNFVKKLRAGY